MKIRTAFSTRGFRQRAASRREERKVRKEIRFLESSSVSAN
ncbi:MAG: hypothetical protein RMY36_019540 [Nostoc sp. SerVER01]